MTTAIPREVAERIRLVVFDVDGVLTDAGVYIGENGAGEGVELKRFDIQDGLGLRLLEEAGIRVAIVSGRVSAATSRRARELGIDECHQDAGARKLPVVRDMMERFGLAWDEVAFVGDDLPDLPVMARAGLPVAVRNGVPEVLAAALWTTTKRGGEGAAREFCQALLSARGALDETVGRYLAERDDARREERDGSR